MMQARKLMVPILAALLLVCGSRLLLAQSATVVVAAEKSVITQHEPTIIDITISNNSPGPIHLDPGHDQEAIGVVVIGPEGKPLEGIPLVRRDGMRFSEAFDVDPASSVVDFVLLNDRFTIENPGNYEIDVTVPSFGGALSTEASGSVRSRLALTVLPRNQAELESACADLASRVKDPLSGSAAITAAKALAAVDDPAVVPFLVVAMQRREFAGLMIRALQRLDTDEAVRALISASRSEDPETRALAHSALLSLGIGGLAHPFPK